MGSDFEIQVAGSSGGAEGPHSAAASAITGVGVGHQDAVGHVNLQRDSETSQKIAEFSEIAGCSGNWDAVLDAQGNVDLTQLARHTHGFRSLTQSEVAAFTGINPQTFVSAYKVSVRGMSACSESLGVKMWQGCVHGIFWKWSFQAHSSPGT
jgi:hypothetical protein